MTDSDEEEYCAKCGDSEFDEDGKKTHDYEPYDHDFVYEEDEGITLDDVKEVADTASSVFKAVKAFKDISDDSLGKQRISKKSAEQLKDLGITSTETPRPPDPEQKRPGVWGRYVLRPIKSKSETNVRLDRIEKKIDRGSKRQNLKWYAGIGVAVVLTIIGFLFI